LIFGEFPFQRIRKGLKTKTFEKVKESNESQVGKGLKIKTFKRVQMVEKVSRQGPLKRFKESKRV
jgi:hypothetical protein